MTGRNELRTETLVIHAGEQRGGEGAVIQPVYSSTVWLSREDADYHSIRYPRLSNLPNHQAVGEKIAALEGAEAALVTSSGLSAIATTLLSFLRAGDHIVAQECLYGGTHSLLTGDFAQLGIEHTFVKTTDVDSWAAAVRPNTKAVYTETITNPLMQVVDHRAVVALARAHDLVSVVDNTYGTPINFRALQLGYDLVVHSATKQLNGHSDVVAGAVAGSAQRIAAVKRKLDHLGGCLAPHECSMLQRGMKTLALRVREQNKSALQLASFLAAHKSVQRVNYPGLTTHPQHSLAKELFSGAGCMLSFQVEPRLARQVLQRTVLFASAPSSGGVESLITIPAFTSHSGMTESERLAIGVNPGLVRISTGIENPDDLVADLSQALAG